MSAFPTPGFRRLTCSMLALAGSVTAGQDLRPLTGEVTTDEIGELVKALGDPSYQERTYATRRLCAVGPPAREALRAAADGADAEVAMRARQLLAVLDQLLFAGTEVTLAFSKSQVAWAEPVDLVVTVENKSKYPARVPFDVDIAARSSAAADARQVMDLLDVADWLKVRAADGRMLELRVDDLNGDPAVLAAVQGRADGASRGIVMPGEKVKITLANFNRGWAHYPLLDEGDYAVVLDYTPEWTDATLFAARAGSVSSNAAVVRIAEGAPLDVSRSGAPSQILVEQAGQEFVAHFQNRTDRTVIINTNFGMAPPFAIGQWVLESGGDRQEVNVVDQSRSTFKEYEPERLVEVQPGQRLELARLALDKARKALLRGTPDRGRAWEIHLSYANLGDRSWQTAQGGMLLGNPDVPPILRESLPHALLGTRLTSNRVPLAAEE